MKILCAVSIIFVSSLSLADTLRGQGQYYRDLDSLTCSLNGRSGVNIPFSQKGDRGNRDFSAQTDGFSASGSYSSIGLTLRIQGDAPIFDSPGFSYMFTVPWDKNLGSAIYFPSLGVECSLELKNGSAP